MDNKPDEMGKVIGRGGMVLPWHILLLLFCLAILGLIIGALS